MISLINPDLIIDRKKDFIKKSAFNLHLIYYETKNYEEFHNTYKKKILVYCRIHWFLKQGNKLFINKK